MLLEFLAGLIISSPFLVLGFFGIYILMISYVFITVVWQILVDIGAKKVIKEVILFAIFFLICILLAR